MIYIYLVLAILGLMSTCKGMRDSFTAEHWDRGWFEVLIGMSFLIIFGREFINLIKV